MPDPTPLVQLTTAHWASMVLLASNRADVFTHLAEEPQTAEDLAALCDADPHALEMLLNACVAHGLLSKGDGRYRNTPLADAFLVRGRPGYLGDGLRYSLDLYPAWGRLPEAVLSGEPAIRPETLLGEDPEKTRGEASDIFSPRTFRGVGSRNPAIHKALVTIIQTVLPAT